MGKALPIARFYALLAVGFFAFNRDHRRWNRRFAGKPIAETPSAFRVRVVKTPRGLKRWHAQVVVGVKRFSLSSDNDRKAASLDAHKILAIQALSRGFGLRRVPAQAATLQSGPTGYSAMRARGTA
jgi:hypothetical protein